MTKLQKLEHDAQKTRDKIQELQDSLKDMDKQRVELENAYIIQMVRASKMTPQELYELLKKDAIPANINDKTYESEETQNES